MRLAFMGTPDFAVPALRALHANGHEIAAVYCQPPRPAGRGQSVRPSPVQREAERLGLAVRHPERLRRDPAEQAAFASLDLDAAVVAAYGLILPQAMLDAPRRGCLNIHASLLPRWRGAAPMQAAILHGDPETGITIMQMEAGLDTGPMLRTGVLPIGPEEDAQSLHDRLAELGARLVLAELAEPSRPERQDDAAATTAPRLVRADGGLDWSRPAAVLHRRVRAMTPWPGAFALLDGVAVRILAATPHESGEALPLPGTVLDDRLLVACGGDTLRIRRLQWPGRAAMDADSFLRGRRIPPGSRFS